MTIDGARRDCETRRDLRNDESSEARARWVVVVPVEDAPLFHYLTKSFASVPDVSVVLERRRGRAVSEAPAHDGLAEDRRAQAQLVSNFGCRVIRRRPPVAPETPASRSRTLLWPNLRISDILTGTEERALRGVDAPPTNGRKT
jgi:hypothetical protein